MGLTCISSRFYYRVSIQEDAFATSDAGLAPIYTCLPSSTLSRLSPIAVRLDQINSETKGANTIPTSKAELREK